MQSVQHVKQPGQQAHMNDGCLMEWQDAIVSFLNEAEAQISVDALIEMYVEFLKFTNEKIPCNLYTIARCVKEYNGMFLTI